MSSPATPAATQTSAGLCAELAAIVGTAHLLVDAEDMLPYLTDWRQRYAGQALCVVRPGSTQQVAHVVAACAAAGVAIVPQGGNTGLVGGSVPSPASQAGGRAQVVVSLKRLDVIRCIDVDNDTITVESGCTLQQVQEAAAAVGRLFPLALASQGTATIGGNLSTNAGGVQVLRYGSMRDLTLGLEVVLADGQVWDGLRALRKDNTGYDLKQLFIGAEGTLGLITAAVLKLYPMPHVRATAWCAVDHPAAAVAMLARLRQACGERVNAFEIVNRTALELVLRHIPDTRSPLVEMHDWQVLIELADVGAGQAHRLDDVLLDFLAAERAAGNLRDAVVAQSAAQAAALWRLRENISEAQKIDGISIKHDVSLPISRIAEFVERAGQELRQAHAGLRIVCFGHIGDGNLHYNPSKSLAGENAEFIAASVAVNGIVHDLVHDLGGSISAEHGLGQLKRDEILNYKNKIEINLMRTIKAALDPHGLMNPGKVI
jgi:FAD/FMN-containing dehydrogenase